MKVRMIVHAQRNLMGQRAAQGTRPASSYAYAYYYYCYGNISRGENII
jgi:hypothetical protein